MRFVRNYGIELALITALGVAVLFFGYLALGLVPGARDNRPFSGEQALEYAGRQMSFGARSTGTQSSLRMGDWLVQQLTGSGWDVVNQQFLLNESLQGRNIIAVRSPRNAETAPVLLLTTHYDTRIAADGDATPSRTLLPAPGANNGASGTAVLLELARTLNVESAGSTICLAFFDADANEGLPGWNGRYGSEHFARSVGNDIPRCASPAAVVALDQVGAESPRFAIDPASEPALSAAIWDVAQGLGYGDHFVSEMADQPLPGGQTAFAQEGIPSAVIQDSAFEGGATLSDTLEHLRASTLEQVGRTLQGWVEGEGS
jgi:glutaminyl-peptide cyclotransferase